MQTPLKILYKKALRNIELGRANRAYYLLSLAIFLRKDLSNLYLVRARAGVMLRLGIKVKYDFQKATQYARDKELVQLKIERIRSEQATLLEKLANETLKKLSVPNSVLAYHFLKVAKSLELDGETKRSLRMYDSAVRNMPDSETIRYELASAYLKAKKYPEALKEFSWIIERNPECCEALIGRGYIKYLRGNTPGAIQDFSAAKVVDPTSFEAVYNLGIALLEEKKNPERALKQFEDVLLIKPDSNDALIGVGRAKLEMKDTVSALKIFEQVRDSDPESGLAWYWIGKTSVLDKKKDIAIDAFNKSCERGYLLAFDTLKEIRNLQLSISPEAETKLRSDHIKRPKSTDEQKVAMYLDVVLAKGNVTPTQDILEENTGIDQTVWSKIMKKNSFWEQLDRLKKEKQRELEYKIALLKDWHVLADERRRSVVEDRPYQERLTSPAVLERTNKPKKEKKKSSDDSSGDEAYQGEYYGGDEVNSGDSSGKSSDQHETYVDPWSEGTEDLLQSLTEPDLRREILFLDPKFDRIQLSEMSREELIRTYKYYK